MRRLDDIDRQAEAEGNAVLRHAQTSGLKKPRGKRTGAATKSSRTAINQLEVKILKRHMEPSK